MDTQATRTVLTVAVYRENQPFRRERLAHDVVKVGRGPGSHLRIDDEHVQRMHAVIEVRSADENTLIDLCPQPETLVNGRRIDARSKCELRPGDHVQIGATLLVLESRSSSPRPLLCPFFPSIRCPRRSSKIRRSATRTR